MSEIYHQPILDYQIFVNGNEVQLGSNTKASFNPGFNKVQIKYKPTNQSLSLYQVRVTEEHQDWGLELGNLAYQNQGGIQANVWHTAEITLSDDVFYYMSEGKKVTNGVYRLSLCARGDIDGTWDIKYLLFTLNGLIFKPTDADGVDLVVTDSVVPDVFDDPQQVGSDIKISQVYSANQDGTNVSIS